MIQCGRKPEKTPQGKTDSSFSPCPHPNNKRSPICGESDCFPGFLHFNTDVASMEHGWNLILVNWEYKIPKDWKVELTELSNGQSVDSRIYPDLQQMFDDMRAQEVYPVVASGYRTAKSSGN